MLGQHVWDELKNNNPNLKQLSIFDSVSLLDMLPFVKLIAENKTLRLLSIDKIDDEMAHELSKNGSIKSLTVTSLRITAKGITKIIENMQQLETLRIKYSNVDDNTTESIAIALEKNSSLKKLDLTENQITDTGAITLLSVLAKRKTSLEIHLSNNDIKDQQLERLSNDSISQLGHYLERKKSNQENNHPNKQTECSSPEPKRFKSH